MRKIGIREIFCSSASAELKIVKLCDYVLGSFIASILPQQDKKHFPSEVSRILVIRPGGIGDAVLLLPVFKAIKIKYPQLIIDVLCQKRNAPIFSSQVHLVDHVFVYESDFKKIQQINYQLIIDTEQWHYLSAVTALAIKADIRVGFATRPRRAKLFNRAIDYDTESYELKNFARLFEDLIGPQDLIKNLDNSFYIAQKMSSWAALQIPAESITLSIGGSVAERRFSVLQMIVLVKGILSRGYHPVFIGGEDALAQSRKVMKHFNDPRILNYVGKISLTETAALMKSSRFFIGTDSGLMHLAAAVGTPVIAIFGAGQMEKWMPPGLKHISINRRLECSPCTAFGYGMPVCKGAFPCISQINLEEVLDQYLSPRVKPC